MSARLRKILAHLGVVETDVFHHDWISATLVKINRYNSNTARFLFELPKGYTRSGLQVTSAIFIRFGETEDDEVIRPYTPISELDNPEMVELLIKMYPQGNASVYMHNMKVGDKIDMLGPVSKYPLKPNQHDHLVLLGGGTGITPLYQLIRGVLSNPLDKTRLTLLYGNVQETDILLKEELDKLQAEHPLQFKIVYTLDHPGPEWKGRVGFIDRDLLEQVTHPSEPNVKIFVCGPPGFYKAMSGEPESALDQGELTGLLKELGYTKDQVYKF
ncbi:hypothetical protein CANCADRAFT_4288 [Tortispora caseinolytica NRRL Y-17796]|uniref:NADH-cytochrome b5 reductase n=1 Tax=Tortispora caseinolytica NRRL Y-17796 TaxID=767744 RepID=A0A1E4TD25_9ASCO|nr:hypothetical protein CANCADRAFT_4288 [Tortispora caseinolytica NRRL Y-17796]